ncbi:MAG: ribosome silencing factor [Rhodoferax sp.]|nr:ribosome silencing factor [Rhodoferax sp.]MCP5260657.1 ribosome silencing factor [Rhodoferax sp.]
MTTDTAAKRNTQKLQRAIVDGLEDVKAQDIQVFDTEHLSSLFERVIVASGTSNRQTKALAASVRDAVREAGFPKPRIEGEANGEWIIVDCAQAVVHIMQPTFRSYYHLEELWGEKPVRLKFGASKPVVEAAAAKKSAAPATPAKAPARKPGAGKTAAGGTAAGKTSRTAATGKPAAKRASTRAAAPDASRPKAAIKTVVVGKPARKAAPAGKRGATAAPARSATRKTPARKA